MLVLGHIAREGILFRSFLRGVDLRSANMDDLDLTGAILIGSNLVLSNFEGTRLDEAEFSTQGGVFCSAHLEGSYLHRASFVRADLRGAFLTHADFTNANFTEAKVEGADLRGVNLDTATFTNAVADGTTKWPEGFDPKAAGVILK